MVVGCIYEENIEGFAEVACLMLYGFAYAHFFSGFSAREHFLNSLVTNVAEGSCIFSDV